MGKEKEDETQGVRENVFFLFLSYPAFLIPVFFPFVALLASAVAVVVVVVDVSGGSDGSGGQCICSSIVFRLFIFVARHGMTGIALFFLMMSMTFVVVVCWNKTQ